MLHQLDFNWGSMSRDRQTCHVVLNPLKGKFANMVITNLSVSKEILLHSAALG